MTWSMHSFPGLGDPDFSALIGYDHSRPWWDYLMRGW